jgi:hypothetical protein
VRYDQIKDYPAAQFRRLTGVSPETFCEMLAAIEGAWRDFGRPPKLSRADQLMLALSYWREYRTFAHAAATYGVSEPTAWRIVRRVEHTLLSSGAFSLPGRRKLERSPAGTYRAVIVDATETEVERPQKSSGGTTAARRSATRSKRN